jgi:hypothetical protein
MALTLGLLSWSGLALARGTPDVPNAAAAFERMKGLVGTWEAVAGDGRKATVRSELVAAGSALLERYLDPKMPAGSERITLYHLDGERLLLTHYCVAKNQPQMRLTHYDPENGVLSFDFLEATNLPDPNAGHMHRARFRSAASTWARWPVPSWSTRRPSPSGWFERKDRSAKAGHASSSLPPRSSPAGSMRCSRSFT